MRIYQMVKLLVFYGFLQIFVTSALAQSDGADDGQKLADKLPPPLVCPSNPLDIDDEAYYKAASLENKAKIAACRWLRGKGSSVYENVVDKEQELYFDFVQSSWSPYEDSAKWGSVRSLVYNDAYLNLVRQFVADAHEQDIEVLVNRDFNDFGIKEEDLVCRPAETRREWYNRVFETLTEKSVVALEARLDRLIRDNGGDTSDFSEVYPPKKLERRVARYITSLVKNFKRKGKKTKVNNILVVATFDVTVGKGENERGESEAGIGILARRSAPLQTMNNSLVENHGNLPKDYPRRKPGKKVGRWINDIKRDLSHTFGTRNLIDEKGYPLILAFGHSAIIDDPDSTQLMRIEEKKSAQYESEDEAYAQLADHVGANFEFAASSSKAIETWVGFKMYNEEGNCRVDEEKKILKKIVERSISSRSRLYNFKGASLRYQDVVRHPNVENVDIVTSVVAWSPEISTKPSTVKKVEKKPVVVNKVSSGVLSSPPLGDPNDF